MSADATPCLLGDIPLSRTELFSMAGRIAGHLVAGRPAANLCADRRSFLLTFAAGMLARAPLLLPVGRTPATAVESLTNYPGYVAITDELIAEWTREPGHVASAPFPQPVGEELALVGFTSGTTGVPQAHAKRWRELTDTARQNSIAIRAELGAAAASIPTIVATVPSHHMYGVELTVLLPLFEGFAVHADRPLFAADVAAVLAAVPTPRILVSTPLHLRALIEAGLAWPEIALIVSATAPLDAALAQRVESSLRAPLLEVLGATETLVVGTRRPAHDREWTLVDGVDLETLEDGTRIHAPWFDAPRTLQDILEPAGDRRFLMRGRNSDLIEVAGKRASLADITRRLCAVPGVADAIAFQPEASASGVAQRVAALVVSEGADERTILASLASGLDPVFLPRPLLLVERIPRDAVGKVRRAQLLETLRPRSSGS